MQSHACYSNTLKLSHWQLVFCFLIIHEVNVSVFIIPGITSLNCNSVLEVLLTLLLIKTNVAAYRTVQTKTISSKSSQITLTDGVTSRFTVVFNTGMVVEV